MTPDIRELVKTASADVRNRLTRPLCWEGEPDEARPGCGGCIHSNIRRVSTGQQGTPCERRYARFYPEK